MPPFGAAHIKKGFDSMYYWETKNMSGYETKLRAALRKIDFYAEDGENVVLKYDPETSPVSPVYLCDLDAFGECPKACKDCENCKPCN